MFVLEIHRRDAPADHGAGKGISKHTIPDAEATEVKKKMMDFGSHPFLSFHDSDAGMHFIAMDTIRYVKLKEHR